VKCTFAVLVRLVYYDHDDTPSATATSNCYGSFQVHNAPDVVLSFCGFAHGANVVNKWYNRQPRRAIIRTPRTRATFEALRAVHCKSLSCHPHRRQHHCPRLHQHHCPHLHQKHNDRRLCHQHQRQRQRQHERQRQSRRPSEASTVAPVTTSVPCECPACSTPADVSIQSTQVHATAESTTTTATTPLLPCAAPVNGSGGGWHNRWSAWHCCHSADWWWRFVCDAQASVVRHDRLPVEMKSAASQRSERADIYNALPSTASSLTDDYRSVSSSSNASYGKLPIATRPSDPYAAGNLAF
jgi:hypothetical protein